MLGTGPPGNKIQTIWLLPKSYHTRTMTAQIMKHTVLYCHQQSWCQIHHLTRHKNLQTTLTQYYKVSSDWAGQKYVGLTFDLNYKNKQVCLSIPGYIKAALTQFQHKTPHKPQDQQYPKIPPEYGAKQQYPFLEDTLPPVH